MLETVALQPDEVQDENEEEELAQLLEKEEKAVSPDSYPVLEPELQKQLEQVKALQGEVVHEDNAPPVGWRVDLFRRPNGTSTSFHAAVE